MKRKAKKYWLARYARAFTKMASFPGFSHFCNVCVLSSNFKFRLLHMNFWLWRSLAYFLKLWKMVLPTSSKVSSWLIAAKSNLMTRLDWAIFGEVDSCSVPLFVEELLLVSSSEVPIPSSGRPASSPEKIKVLRIFTIYPLFPRNDCSHLFPLPHYHRCVKNIIERFPTFSWGHDSNRIPNEFP